MAELGRPVARWVAPTQVQGRLLEQERAGEDIQFELEVTGKHYHYDPQWG
jgi:hypothetical protein